MKKALIIFARTPVLGTVKTRLQPHLNPEKTLRLYKSFVKEIVLRCTRLKGIDKFIGCTPTKDNNFFKELTAAHSIRSFNQTGKNLGEKIVNAFRDYFRKGYTKIVIIGTDSPTIPLEYIKMAFRELNKKDFVLGPCCDGGLYLIGSRKKIIPAIFHNIPWDTSAVLNKMLKKINSMNISLFMLPFWYDVDTIDSLRFLKNHQRYLEKSKKT